MKRKNNLEVYIYKGNKDFFTNFLITKFINISYCKINQSNSEM